MTIDEFKDVVREIVRGGVSPNDLAAALEVAASECDWALWGDDRWRQDYVCAKCGSPYAGICGTPENAKGIAEYRGCTDEKPILASEWRRRQEAAALSPQADPA